MWRAKAGAFRLHLPGLLGRRRFSRKPRRCRRSRGPEVAWLGGPEYLVVHVFLDVLVAARRLPILDGHGRCRLPSSCLCCRCCRLCAISARHLVLHAQKVSDGRVLGARSRKLQVTMGGPDKQGTQPGSWPLGTCNQGREQCCRSRIAQQQRWKCRCGE